MNPSFLGHLQDMCSSPIASHTRNSERCICSIGTAGFFSHEVHAGLCGHSQTDPKTLGTLERAILVRYWDFSYSSLLHLHFQHTLSYPTFLPRAPLWVGWHLGVHLRLSQAGSGELRCWLRSRLMGALHCIFCAKFQQHGPYQNSWKPRFWLPKLYVKLSQLHRLKLLNLQLEITKKKRNADGQVSVSSSYFTSIQWVYRKPSGSHDIGKTMGWCFSGQGAKIWNELKSIPVVMVSASKPCKMTCGTVFIYDASHFPFDNQ